MNEFNIAIDVILNELSDYEDRFITDIAKRVKQPEDSTDQIVKKTIHEVIRLAKLADDHIIK